MVLRSYANQSVLQALRRLMLYREFRGAAEWVTWQHAHLLDRICRALAAIDEHPDAALDYFREDRDLISEIPDDPSGLISDGGPPD